MKTYIIAESGSCHDGDLGKALDLVQTARASGADAVKFQYWGDPDDLADRRRVPAHYREIYRRYQLRDEWVRVLALAAEQAGLDFLCTAFLPADVPFLAHYVAHFKVASFEAGAADLIAAHVPFLDADMTRRAVAGQAHPLRLFIVSAGMGGFGSARDPMPPGLPERFFGVLRVLHCTSAYPAPIESLNLRRISQTDPGLLPLDGFSDHSAPHLTDTGALAVAAGASMVEAHLRLPGTMPDNPDAPHAMLPHEFRDYVSRIRFAEVCLGDGELGMHPSEAPMAAYRVRS